MNDLSHISPLGWVVSNNFVTENQQPLEFKDRRYLIQPMSDFHPHQVYKKSAQVGESVEKIIKSFWVNKELKLNVGYVLPSKNIVKDFVTPKVDPLINSNPALSALVSSDTITLKQIANRFTYFRGAYSEREAIAISLDVLVLDEKDRMPNQTVVNTYKSRLQASKYGWIWELSNPSVEGYGVDATYRDSDQMHWFVKCSHCGYETFLDWERSELVTKSGTRYSHYVHQDKEIYACGKCGKEIYDDDRRNGRWVAKYPKRTEDNKGIRGYWISQMMCAWVSAAHLVKTYHESTSEFFHNYVLGKAYTATDVKMNRDVIVQAMSPQKMLETNVAMGVDNGTTKHYVIGTPYGIFKYGKTDSWDEIEYLIKRYNAYAVLDPMPYQVTPKKLVQQFPGKVFICYYQKDRKGLGIVRWGEGKDRGVVFADRTKIFDMLVGEIQDKKLLFGMTLSELEPYISHWTPMYRVVEENNLGVPMGKWLTIEGKPNHWAHSTVYYRLALDKMLSGMGAGVVRREKQYSHKDIAPTVKDGKIEVAFNLEKAYESSKRHRQS